MDGEIFIYLTILGVLGHLQSHLMTLSFEGIIKALSNLQVRQRIALGIRAINAGCRVSTRTTCSSK